MLQICIDDLPTPFIKRWNDPSYWPHLIAWGAVGICLLALACDASLAGLGVGDFAWEYAVYWTCGGVLSVCLFYPNVGPFFVANIAACQMHDVSPSVRFLFPLFVYLGAAWLQWWVIGFAARSASSTR